MAYTSDKKPGALTAATVLDGNNNVVIEQSGDVKRATLSQVEAKIFAAKTEVSTPTGTEVAIVRLTDGNLRQVALSNIVPALNITNAKVSDSAAIVDTKLATIATAGKVSNSATTATSANTINAIVSRDGSGNFSAGTITATLAGSITGSAPTLTTGRTIALTGDVTGTTGAFNGSADVSAATTIANNAVTTVKIADSNVTTAKIADSNVTTTKIADLNVTTAKIADSNVTTEKIADSNVTTEKIADSNVTTAKIADTGVTQAKLAANVAGNGPAFRAYLGSNLSLGTGAFGILSINAEDYDTNSNFNTTNFRFTPTVEGYYQLNGGIICGDGAQLLCVSIFKNAVEHSRGVQVQGVTFNSQVSDVVYFNGSTDYADLRAAQSSGTTKTINQGSVGCYFSGCLVRAA